MDIEVIKNAYEEAVEAVSNLPEAYKAESFSVLFDRFLRQDSGEASKSMPPTLPPPPRKLDYEDRDEMLKGILSTRLDFSPYFETLLDTSWEERAVIILGTIEENLGIDSLTAPEFAEIMTKQINLRNVHRQNVYRDLKKSQYFLQTRDGRSLIFSLSLLGKRKYAELKKEID